MIVAATSRGLSGKSIYMVGSYNNHRFTPEVQGFLDTHPMACFHCPRTLIDQDGRRIMMGVLAERRLVSDNPHGWAGVLSLSRLLELGSDNRLLISPVMEVCSYGAPDWAVEKVQLLKNTPFTLRDGKGDCLEIIAEIDMGSSEEILLKLRRSANGEEETVVCYDRKKNVLMVDTTRASLSTDTGHTVSEALFVGKKVDRLRLHVFLDRSVIEVFANRRVSASDRLYPIRDDSLGIQVMARTGTASLISLKIWRKESIFFPS